MHALIALCYTSTRRSKQNKNKRTNKIKAMRKKNQRPHPKKTKQTKGHEKNQANAQLKNAIAFPALWSICVTELFCARAAWVRVRAPTCKVQGACALAGARSRVRARGCLESGRAKGGSEMTIKAKNDGSKVRSAKE